MSVEITGVRARRPVYPGATGCKDKCKDFIALYGIAACCKGVLVITAGLIVDNDFRFDFRFVLPENRRLLRSGFRLLDFNEHVALGPELPVDFPKVHLAQINSTQKFGSV